MTHQTEQTFTKFNNEKAKNYAKVRPDYHSSVYETIINHHRSSGGSFNALLDIGCGPGTATETLAKSFQHAIGLDPSDGMVQTAKAGGCLSATGEAVQFEISSAEELGSNLPGPIQDTSIDLITAANAAHWFDMPRFWQAAARVLRPGGSVALWTTGEIRVHPDMPNAQALQAALDRIDEEELLPYYAPGNLLTRNGYRDLPMPWTSSPPVTDFEQSTFFRKEWDPADTTSPDFMTGQHTVDLDTFEKVMSTSSPLIRWREAHPEDVGTERDIVRRERRVMEELLREAGVKEGEEKMRGSIRGVVMIVKKKALD